MTASVSLRAYTGTDAGTESSAQTAIVLVDVDALTGGPVIPGTNSYERWLRLKLDVAPQVGVTNFWLQNDGILPDGVVIKFGVTDTATTPTDALSTVATTTLESGRRFIWDVNTYTEAGETTRYLVLQEQAAGAAPSGAIPQNVAMIGWSES